MKKEKIDCFYLGSNCHIELGYACFGCESYAADRCSLFCKRFDSLSGSNVPYSTSFVLYQVMQGITTPFHTLLLNVFVNYQPDPEANKFPPMKDLLE
jgi:hypothetical protein